MKYLHIYSYNYIRILISLTFSFNRFYILRIQRNLSWKFLKIAQGDEKRSNGTGWVLLDLKDSLVVGNQIWIYYSWKFLNFKWPLNFEFEKTGKIWISNDRWIFNDSWNFGSKQNNFRNFLANPNDYKLSWLN